MRFSSLKGFIAAIIILTLLFVSALSCFAQTATVVDKTALYQTYYPIFGWTNVGSQQTYYRTLSYTNGYAFVRAENYVVMYTNQPFAGRVIGVQYYYQTW
jgi:hypothetical protein